MLHSLWQNVCVQDLNPKWHAPFPMAKCVCVYRTWILADMLLSLWKNVCLRDSKPNCCVLFSNSSGDAEQTVSAGEERSHPQRVPGGGDVLTHCAAADRPWHPAHCPHPGGPLPAVWAGGHHHQHDCQCQECRRSVPLACVLFLFLLPQNNATWTWNFGSLKLK